MPFRNTFSMRLKNSRSGKPQAPDQLLRACELHARIRYFAHVGPPSSLRPRLVVTEFCH